MTWFNGKSFGSYLGGARFEFLLAPFFTYKFIYLFYLALVTSTVRTPTVSTCAFRPSRAPRPCRLMCTRDQTDQSMSPDRTESILTSRPTNRPTEPDVPNCFKIISSSSYKHFSHEQFRLDHLVLHTLRYEVMGFGSSYIL